MLHTVATIQKIGGVMKKKDKTKPSFTKPNAVVLPNIPTITFLDIYLT